MRFLRACPSKQECREIPFTVSLSGTEENAIWPSILPTSPPPALGNFIRSFQKRKDLHEQIYTERTILLKNVKL